MIAPNPRDIRGEPRATGLERVAAVGCRQPMTVGSSTNLAVARVDGSGPQPCGADLKPVPSGPGARQSRPPPSPARLRTVRRDLRTTDGEVRNVCPERPGVSKCADRPAGDSGRASREPGARARRSAATVPEPPTTGRNRADPFDHPDRVAERLGRAGGGSPGTDRDSLRSARGAAPAFPEAAPRPSGRGPGGGVVLSVACTPNRQVGGTRVDRPWRPSGRGVGNGTA